MNPFKTIQRRVKIALATLLGAINVAGVWFGSQLLNHPLSLGWVNSLIGWITQPFLSLPLPNLAPLPTALPQILSWITHPLQIHWIHFSLAQLLPFLVPTLTTLNSAYGIATAVSVIVLTTTLSVGLVVWLLTLDIPNSFALWVNQRRALAAKHQLERLMSQLDQLDLDRLSLDDARLLIPLTRAVKQIVTSAEDPFFQKRPWLIPAVFEA